MTTTHTFYGRYRWLRLPFVITSAPEEFQMGLTTALKGLDGIICVADDILVFGEGTNFEEAQEDHNRGFIPLKERCHQRTIKLNTTKLQLKLKEVKFMGKIISYEGRKPEGGARKPTPVLAYYDLHKPVVLQTDACDYAVGGAPLQPSDNGQLQPVAYTSPSVNPTEQRYSQIEKECLAICNCFQKFDQWLYGKPDIKVHTGHQPLETTMKKPPNKALARLQRMLMRLQRYQFTVNYKRGPTLHLADTLSRAAFPQPVAAQVTNLDVFRIEVESEYNTRNPRLTETTENQLREETSKDATVTTLYKVIVSGWPDDKAAIPESLRPYWNYRDELSVQNGIIYKGIQFMHKEMLCKIHAYHFGADSNMRIAHEVLILARNEKVHSRHV